MKKCAINILTIFPEQVGSYVSAGILNRAAEKDIVDFNIVDIRDFSEDKHRKVDDIPYGGGPGMVMAAPPIVRALDSLVSPGQRILLAPDGEKFDRDMAAELSGKDITLICGRYTGVDRRVRKFTDRIVSVGDFIVSGGELPALIVAEAAVRLISGVLGDERSLEEDRGYPVYTRPREFRGMEVPEVLLSGDHKKISKYRDQEAGYDKSD